MLVVTFLNKYIDLTQQTSNIISYKNVKKKDFQSIVRKKGDESLNMPSWVGFEPRSSLPIVEHATDVLLLIPHIDEPFL